MEGNLHRQVFHLEPPQSGDVFQRLQPVGLNELIDLWHQLGVDYQGKNICANCQCQGQDQSQPTKALWEIIPSHCFFQSERRQNDQPQAGQSCAAHVKKLDERCRNNQKVKTAQPERGPPTRANFRPSCFGDGSQERQQKGGAADENYETQRLRLVEEFAGIECAKCSQQPRVNSRKGGHTFKATESVITGANRVDANQKKLDLVEYHG